jgi:hypothetical protein
MGIFMTAGRTVAFKQRVILVFMAGWISLSSLALALLYPSTTAQALSITDQQKCTQLLDGKGVVYSSESLGTIVSAPFNFKPGSAERTLHDSCVNKSDSLKNCTISSALKSPVGYQVKWACPAPTSINAYDQGNATAKKLYLDALLSKLCQSGQGTDSVSQCRSKLTSEFTSCFDGYVQNNEDFVYPKYDLKFIATCTADHTGYGKAAILSALTSADVAVQKAITGIDSELGAATPGNKDVTSCAIDGIGWIACPVAKAVATFIGLMYELLSSFLKVSPISTNLDSPLYKAWDVMRAIANVVFVIIFLLVIYSQITGGGRK